MTVEQSHLLDEPLKQLTFLKQEINYITSTLTKEEQRDPILCNKLDELNQKISQLEALIKQFESEI